MFGRFCRKSNRNWFIVLAQFNLVKISSEFSTKFRDKEILFKIAQYFQPNPEAREFRWRYTEFFNEIQRREGFIKKEYDFLTGPRTLDIWLKIR